MALVIAVWRQRLLSAGLNTEFESSALYCLPLELGPRAPSPCFETKKLGFNRHHCLTFLRITVTARRLFNLMIRVIGTVGRFLVF